MHVIFADDQSSYLELKQFGIMAPSWSQFEIMDSLRNLNKFVHACEVFWIVQKELQDFPRL